MEALFLGLLCIAFSVDGMAELLKNGVNGETVKSVKELPTAVLNCKRLTRGHRENPKPCLLPEEFRQKNVVGSMIEVFHERL